MDKSLSITNTANYCTTKTTTTTETNTFCTVNSSSSTTMEASTTTTSTVSSTTNPFISHNTSTKANPFCSSNNNKTNTESDSTGKCQGSGDSKTTNIIKTSIDSKEKMQCPSPTTTTTTTLTTAKASTQESEYEGQSMSLQSNAVSEFTNTHNINCGSLPRKFERLNLSSSIGTKSETVIIPTKTTNKDDSANDTNSRHRIANKQDFEGIVTTTTNHINSSYCYCNSNTNYYYINSSTIKSPSNPFVTLTGISSITTNISNITNNELASRTISKCLSQSSSTTTITSSSSRTSSMLIESPSLTMTPQIGSMSMSPSPPPYLPSITLANSNNINNNNNQFTSHQSLTNFPTPSSSPPSSPLPPLPKIPSATPHIRILPKLHSLDLADEHCIHIDQDDIDADVDDDDDTGTRTGTRRALPHIRQQVHGLEGSRRLGVVSQTRSEENDRDDESKAQSQSSGMKHSKSELTATTLNSPPKGMIPKIQATIDSRPIYPNVPYSPYGSPYGSPRSNRRRTPLRESRRISIEQSGSFLQLNQYKLMDQIGQGSYGLVKLAYSEEDSTHYAMKILSKRRLLRKAGLMGRGPKRTTSPLDRVYREIAVLKKLDHPNVVKLVEVLDDPLEDSLYLVFELVQQGEVLSVPTDRPLSEERAWCVFRDSLQGLEYLHYQRIIHADIKPGNLLLGECGRVKIADLGVCNEFLGEDATMNNGSTAGTPAFRAPETLIPGQHLYSGKAADIWALGATLYSLVYGNVPFVAKSVPALYEKIKHDQLILPEFPKISNELRDLIEKILTKDPSKRITLPQIKEHPWVTSNGAYPLPSEEENCRLVQISDEDINTVVKSIPKLDTLILIKTMLKNHSFQNPFSRGISGRAPQRGGSRLERFTRAGRSNSAPGAYHLSERQLSSENILPSVSEGVASSCNESSDQSADG